MAHREHYPLICILAAAFVMWVAAIGAMVGFAYLLAGLEHMLTRMAGLS